MTKEEYDRLAEGGPDRFLDFLRNDMLDDGSILKHEISFNRQPDRIDVLLTNSLCPKGSKEPKDTQQAVISLSKEDSKKLRDYLNSEQL